MENEYFGYMNPFCLWYEENDSLFNIPTTSFQLHEETISASQSFFWNHIDVFSKYFFSKFHFTTWIVLFVCFSSFTYLRQPLGNEWQWGLVAMSPHSLQCFGFFFSSLFPFAVYLAAWRHMSLSTRLVLYWALVARPPHLCPRHFCSLCCYSHSGPQPWLPAVLTSTQASWFLRAPLGLLAWLCDWYPKWPESEFSFEQ